MVIQIYQLLTVTNQSPPKSEEWVFGLFGIFGVLKLRGLSRNQIMTRNDSSCRGCHRMLRNYLNDNETTLEYNTNDHLSNIDNPLLLNIQSIIDVGIRRKNLRHGFLILIGQRAQALIGRRRTGQCISLN